MRDWRLFGELLRKLLRDSIRQTSVPELALSLERNLETALHPRSLELYVRQTDGSFRVVTRTIDERHRSIPADSPVLTELAKRGKPWDLSSTEESERLFETSLAGFEAECMVPMAGRSADLFGVLILGPRLSEEPYSGEDKRLLAAVGSQAGVALENIRLAEQIAESMEAERRAVREMEIAKDVQRRLLPQSPPALQTLDCAAQCIQARSVGGDCFDFLDLGNRQVGFVLADVSGTDGQARRLPATATVLGLFEQWEGEVGRIQFAPGEVLVIFSDGITEAAHDEEEFGEDRLVGLVTAVRCKPAAEIVAGVLEAVEQFGSGSQSDDLTLLVLRSVALTGS